MRQQRRLDFRTGDVVARGNDHVVGARHEAEIAVLVAHERVAGQIPAVADVGRLAAVGEIAAAGGAAHGQPPGRVRRQRVHVVVDDARLVAGHRAAGDAGLRIAEARADEDVDHLGRTEAVEDRHAGARDPVLMHGRRQRLAGRTGDAQRGQVDAFAERGEHDAVGGRRGEHHRRAVRLDVFHQVRRRRVFQQHGGRAEPQREDGETAEAEGEGERRRTDDDILGRDLQNLVRIAVGHDEHVAMEMHRRLRLAGRARRESQERNIVASGARGVELLRLRQRSAVELGLVRRAAVEMNHALQEAAGRGYGVQVLGDAAVGQRQRDFSLVDDLGELAGAQHRHGVDDDGARLGRSQPGGDHRRIVGRTHEHAIAGPDAEILDQRMRQLVRPLAEFAIGALSAVADQGDAFAESLFDQPVAQFDADVEPIPILKFRPIEQEIRPKLRRRQIVARKRVDVAGWTERLSWRSCDFRHPPSHALRIVSPPSPRRRRSAAPVR